ncbi:MAG TPA: AAA family ATPase [Solirubrobacteraceae bacterium]|nr:AAA family ATPase [Solirubrobacteraceae bacterium]
MAVKDPPAFLGRSSERGLLDRLLDSVRQGQSRVLVIRGEAGLGKTALLRHAVSRAAGFKVAQIAGVESEMELPFAGLHQLCAPMLSEIDMLPEPQRDALSIAFGLSFGNAPDPFLVALAALSLLARTAEAQPLLCVVDDAQWLDVASAQILGFVARRLLAESIAIVFAVREPSGEHELAGLSELRLTGLHDEDAHALLASVVSGRLDAPVSDRIVAETRGNPLAILELSRGMTSAELAGGFALPDALDVPARIEERYRQRSDQLPAATQQLMLLAAADPVGDAALLWRAAARLGLTLESAEPAAEAGLLEIGAQVRFRHPLVRSAVYRSAPPAARRAVHGALAAATDPDTDLDRRAWHLAHAATAPDEAVAAELIDCAGRAQRRGGVAAAAAFLERSVTFTFDPGERARRALAAARAKFEAADFSSAQSLLALADAGPLDELGRAKVQGMRAQIAFDLRRGSDAPALLLSAARRFEALDVELARETYLEALLSAIYAAGLARGTDAAAVASAALSAPLGGEPVTSRQLLLRGLATRFTEGYAASAPALRDALLAHRGEERRLDWLSVAYDLAAMELWDDAAWLELASGQAELARATGTLILLPYALDYLAAFQVQAGDLSLAAGLVAEAQGLDLGVRAETLPYIALRLAAWRGQASTVSNLVDVMRRGARERGEGSAITAADYSAAVLHNGLGQYELALEAAEKAAATDELVTSSWALYELIEAASRSGQHAAASRALDRLADRTRASGTAWAKGTEARSRALVEEGEAAEQLYREAIEWLGHTRMASYLARARLTYGEWLRREGRRVEAREQLRDAYGTFSSMGAAGFADRTQRELQATGEKVRKRQADARDELTPQQLRVAALARDGRTNSEIAAELYLSPRTVEWHLRQVFTKLGIRSRIQLHGALPSREREATSA